ncbi:hypothetical protein BH23CHL8_BH23CHL8_05870 [soil metagenome]
MTIRRSSFLLGLTLTAASAGPAWAQQQGADGAAHGTGEALLQVLSRVPASAEVLAAPLSYVDYRALETARPGAATPASFAELMALLEADDASGNAWFAAAQGISSGPSALLRELFSEGALWPDSVGLDFFDIDRAAQFGSPPATGVVLLGAFQPEAIAAAYEGRGYTGTTVGERTLWCSEAGCDTGLQVDLARRDPSVPFGGRLGRREPLAVSAQDVLSSADLATLEGMLAAASGEAPAVADHPAYRALALAPRSDVAVIQATLLSGDQVAPAPDLIGLLDASPEDAAALLAELTNTLEPLPVAEAIGIFDGATATEQVVTIALAFAAEPDAALAADSVIQRLGAARSLVSDVSMSELLAERGVTAIDGWTLPATEGVLGVAVIELRAPLAAEGPDPGSGSMTPSSRLYRLFVDMIYRRDVLWLAPSVAPAE